MLAGEAHVWLVPLEVDASDFHAMDEVLCVEERDRAARFKIAGGRERYTMGRGFLRLLLGHYVKVEPAALSFRYNSYGKPSLPDGGGNLGSVAPIGFNLSHSGGYAVLGFTREGELGVDIEKYREEVLREKLADRFFAPQEAQELASLPPEDQLPGFFACWTRKEAYIKARGDGLSRSLSSFAVSLRAQEPAVLRWCHDDPEVSSRWRVWNLAVPSGYAGCLVGPAGASRCREFDLTGVIKPQLVSGAGSATH